MPDREQSQLRLLWVTNLPAPYRIPAWDALAESHLLDVWCLGETERNRTWPLPDPEAHRFSLRTLASRTITRGEITVYLPPLRFPDVSAYDVIVIGGWESPFYWRLAHAARRQGIRTVAFYESTLSSQRFTSGPAAWVRRRFFKQAGAVITVGSASTEAMLAMGVNRERIHESFNSVDVTRFHRALAERPATDPDAAPGHRFVYVGQLIERKNVANLLEAFAAVREPRDSLTIVGEGDRRAELTAHSRALGLTPHVTFTGALTESEVIDVFSGSDTLVLPSTLEVWGLVANEALAAGLHAVVTSACGVAPNIEGMKGVTLVEPTVTSIAAGMRTSRETWNGPIMKPEMLEHGADGLADAVEQAIAHQRA